MKGSLSSRLKNCGMYYKRFTIVIYDCNDSGQHYKTKNYNSSVVRPQFGAFLTIVIYDRNDSGQYYKTINYNSSDVNK